MKNPIRLLAGTGVLAGLSLGWAVGCGSTDSSAQATLGPAGGSLAVPGSSVELVVPAGALTQSVSVSVQTSRSAAALTVSLQPVDLTLARAATLSVTVPGPAHFSGVTETRSGRPVGLDARIEGPSSAVARLSMDRFREMRFSTEAADGGGGAPGACHEFDEGERHGSGHEVGHDADGGQHDGDAGQPAPVPDGGVGPMACPAGFECDDGVCVAPGGNDEHHGECDGGSCHDGHDDDGSDAGHH